MGAKKNMETNKTADSKGRVTLGEKHSDKQFIVIEQANGEILLRPSVTVPIQEAWLWQNVQAMKSVQEGLKQLKSKTRINKGSFSKYVEDEE